MKSRLELSANAQQTILSTLMQVGKQSGASDHEALKVVLRALWQVSDVFTKESIERFVQDLGKAKPPQSPERTARERRHRRVVTHSYLGSPGDRGASEPAYDARRGYELSRQSVFEHNLVRSAMNRKLYE